ncbi:MAG: hypothetical protein CH6_1671 [Candidatus Kapaibacterium sp.]|nr:MAG: hypothetical protein CH6_1671 [Candidatus Kapabacteria bacterium]
MLFVRLYNCFYNSERDDYFITLHLPKTRALKIILFKHYVTDAPI